MGLYLPVLTGAQGVLKGAPAGDIHGVANGGDGRPRSLCILRASGGNPPRLAWHNEYGNQYAAAGRNVGTTTRPDGSTWISAGTGRVRFALGGVMYEVGNAFTYVITQERDPNGLLNFQIRTTGSNINIVDGSILQYNPAVSPQAGQPGYSQYTLAYGTQYTLVYNTPGTGNGEIPFRTANSPSDYAAGVAGGRPFVKIDLYGPNNMYLAINTF